MAEMDYSVREHNNGILLEGPLFAGPSNEGWAAKELGLNRVLIQPKDSQTQMGNGNYGNVWCSVDAFADLLFGLHHRRWNGAVVVDTGLGIKKVFFDHGHIVFATTSNIDERLGEIIYRKGMLTLDDLMNCSVQVTKKDKFGQILLRDGVFSNSQLWVALKAQVKEIVRSIFMVNHVYFELNPDAPPAPTEVVYLEGTEELIDSCYGYGCMFRDFASRISLSSKVIVPDYEEIIQKMSAESFDADLLTMVHEHKQVGKILESSKLMQASTLGSLMDLVNQGYCFIDPYSKSSMKLDSSNLADLRGRLDAYALTLQDVRKAFTIESVRLPVEDIRSMADDLDNDRSFTLFIDDQGEITHGSIERIFSQCKTVYKRARYFEQRVRLLTLFLLQIAGDNLPYESAKQIRQSCRSYS